MDILYTTRDIGGLKRGGGGSGRRHLLLPGAADACMYGLRGHGVGLSREIRTISTMAVV